VNGIEQQDRNFFLFISILTLVAGVAFYFVLDVSIERTVFVAGVIALFGSINYWVKRKRLYLRAKIRKITNDEALPGSTELAMVRFFYGKEKEALASLYIELHSNPDNFVLQRVISELEEFVNDNG